MLKKKKRDQFYYCQVSTKPEAVFLFLLTKQYRGILNVAFFSERRHCLADAEASQQSSSQGFSSKLRCFDHICQHCWEAPSQCWKVTAYFMPCMNFEQQCTSPDSSSFQWRELAHQPQPHRACTVINLHSCSWKSHSYGFMTWKRNSILVYLWLHRQRPDPETGQEWEVKMDGRSWEKNMSWPGATDSHPAYSTAQWQGSVT